MNSRSLIRFDWAIKRLLRNKANFTILEGFLSELLREMVSIVTILESEGNQKFENDKYNRVDILVKNSKDELVIVEVQNQNEYDYFHRMAYGTSKVITEYISVGEPYKNVKKVYSVNIVYFDLGQGDDYIYYGKTDFVGIHKKDKLRLSDKQVEILGKSEPFEIFPEYYVIKVNQFNDNAISTLDEWIYYLKNNEVRDEFTAKGIDKVKELLRVDNLSEEDLASYKKYQEDLRYSASMAWTLKVDEEDRIRKEERKNEKKQIAKGMKQKNIDIKTIIEITGLTEEDIGKL
ncbi:MAG TPA: Rpn family recombination-promoting nuclease/putative transposase [Tenuifilaceae bacterium]|nr:Rpn family recombination-promoting nuclease/putative transposase [Tenuifilaceae bacterium]HQB77230.1 Rpn family recombination-promoting nuclease/putative transposase [Tenuifilaceae bacterium]